MKTTGNNKKKSTARRTWRSILIFAIIYLILAGAFTLLEYHVERERLQVTTLSATAESSEFEGTGCSVSITISQKWMNGDWLGAQYDGVIANTSETEINDWQLRLTVPAGSWIDSDWNGVYEFIEDGAVLLISPLDYNSTVLPGSDQTFGMVMYTTGVFDPTDYSFSFYTNPEITQYPAFYVILSLVVLVTVGLIAMIISEIRVFTYRRKQAHYKKVIDETLDAFANVIDAKDEYTNGHSARVAIYSLELARRMGLSETQQENIGIIAQLHDIGKVGIPDAILNKPGKLSDEEMEKIRAHTTVGQRILSKFTSVENIANGAHYHHERFDGTGYPSGLSGKNIPLCARIICIADAYDAMSSTRCYRSMLSGEEIIEELRRCSGTQFDPDIVPHMIAMIESGSVPVNLSSGEENTSK